MQRYEGFIRTDADELWARIDDAQARFTELVRRIGPEVKANGSTWSARDVVGHILTVTRRYTDRELTDRAGLADTAREVDTINDVELAALRGIPMEELLVELEQQMKKVRDLLPPDAVDFQQVFPFHGGTSVDAAGGLSNFMGEFLVHGLDLARSMDDPWPIEARDARLILMMLLQVAPGWAEPSAKGSLKVRLRVPGATEWMLAFNGGALVSRPADPGEPADVILKAPADTLMLLFYQRVSPGAAMRRGLRVAGGRRPWRIARFPKMLQEP